jgi:hypothetical protein
MKSAPFHYCGGTKSLCTLDFNPTTATGSAQ